MKHLGKGISVNLGGVIGGLVCGGVAGAFIIPYVVEIDDIRDFKFVIVSAVIGGALAGNFLWDFIFEELE